MKLKECFLYLKEIMERFYPIGDDGKGGVTRLAYTDSEDKMHEEFANIGIEEGYHVEVDEVGNTFLSIGKEEEWETDVAENV